MANSRPTTRDAIEALVTEGAGTIDTEVVVHVRGDGNTLDDGKPLPDSIVAGLIPTAFISALVQDAKGNPIDATNRRRQTRCCCSAFAYS